MSTGIYRSDEGRDSVLGIYRDLLRQWPVANKQYHVATPLGETFVIESGEPHKPPLILLHGSVSSSFTWMGDVARYSETHRVFAVDLVGEPGLSAPTRPDYESGEYAVWLRAIVDSLGLDKVALIGLSLGGWMALEFATTFPERVERLGLICPGGLGRQRLSLLPKAIFYSLMGQWGRNRMTRMLNGGRMPRSEGLNRAMAITMSISKHFRPRTARLPIFTAARLARLDMPVLVLFGDTDCVLDGAASLAHARDCIARCEAIELPDTGHLILDQGARLSQFLTQSKEPAGPGKTTGDSVPSAATLETPKK